MLVSPLPPVAGDSREMRDTRVVGPPWVRRQGSGGWKRQNIARRHFMNDRLIRAGPGTGEGESRRIERPAATPADHPELHSETVLSNDNPGCTPAPTGLETSCRFRGLPRSRSLGQPERSVPRFPGAVPVPGSCRPFPPPVSRSNARAAAEGLRVPAPVVGTAYGGPRRPWTETVLSGGGSASPCTPDLGGAAGAGVPAHRLPDCPEAPAGVTSTASGDRRERSRRSPGEQQRREGNAAGAGRRVADFRDLLSETISCLGFTGKKTAAAKYGVKVLGTPVEWPVIVSVDPDVATTRRTPELTPNVSTVHTGMGGLGAPGPGRAIGRAA